jgi:acyl-CoA reductase-like NAD-dependent aldehyde dehydrogenase
MYVLEDADVALAAKAAWFGVTVNRGQTCIAVRRVLVHRSRYEAFIEALRPLVATTPPLRLALASQVRQVKQLLQQARDERARILAGGVDTSRSPDGEMCALCVILDARPEMAIWQEASFAPLMAMLPFDTIEEALTLDAACRFGLGASVFTDNPARALELAARLRAGMVSINDVVVPATHPATPFGGRGASGWGVTQGAEGLLQMTVPQVVSVRGGRFRPHYDPPGSNRLSQPQTLRALLEWKHAGSWWGRWRGFFRFLRSLWRKTP